MSKAPFIAPERDGAFRRGRPRNTSSGTNWYTIPGRTVRGQSTNVDAINTDYYGPFFVEAPILVDQLALELTVPGSGNMRLGVYAADTDYQPAGPPLLDSGNIANNSSGVNTYTPGSPLYLPRGRYLTVRNCSSAMTVRVLIPVMGDLINSAIGTAALVQDMTVGRTFAAFPTPGAGWSGGTANITHHAVVLRVSAP